MIKKAVAVKYPKGAEVPFITAKGSGVIAEKILNEAKKNNIRIEENQTLVDVLSLQQVGDAVSEETYQALAVIFAHILGERK